MASRKRSISHEADACAALHKELDEASCPICMDHPHNAVLLLCTSHDKGCRPYICDTSYRHSNCLDRFKKLREDDSNNSPPVPGSSSPRSQQSNTVINLDSTTPTDSIEPVANSDQGEGNQGADGHLQEILETGNFEDNNVESSPESIFNLRCPMCRGAVLGWKVVDEARKYLNLKARSCSREMCSFSGNYRDLRRHARRLHPMVRPGDIDPSRQRAWRRLQNQREYADIVSAIRSAMPGAVVFGDYAIENGEREQRASGEVNGLSRASGEINGPLWTTFLLFQMIESMDSDTGTRRGSRVRAGHRRSSGEFPRRRYLWGESLLGLQDDNDDNGGDNNEELMDIVNNAVEDESPVPRRRRRLTRYRSDEDQS